VTEASVAEAVVDLQVVVVVEGFLLARLVEEAQQVQKGSGAGVLVQLFVVVAVVVARVAVSTLEVVVGPQVEEGSAGVPLVVAVVLWAL
jgi:hypothetical protein